MLFTGLTGASTSSVTKHVNEKFATPLRVPLVSYMSTAQSLTKDMPHPKFMRTVSPDGTLMDVSLIIYHRKPDTLVGAKHRLNS